MNAEEGYGNLHELFLESESDPFSREELLEETKAMFLLGAPLALLNFIGTLSRTVTLVFAGHVGGLPLSATTVALSFTFLTGQSILAGMASVLETFCGQSCGAKKFKTAGDHLVSAIAALLLVNVFLSLIAINAGTILPLLGQNHEISSLAGTYTILLVPGSFGFAIYICYAKFLQSQKNLAPLLMASVITIIGQFFTCWLLVHVFHFGNNGNIIALSVVDWINALFLVVYVRASPSCNLSRPSFSWDAFCGIPKIIKLSLHSVLMFWLAVLSVQTITLSAGLLGNPEFQTSALSLRFVCFTTLCSYLSFCLLLSLNATIMWNTVSSGLSSATSVIISNKLGAKKARSAQLAAGVSLLVTVAGCILVSLVLLFCRHAWISMYTDDQTLVEYVSEILLFFGFGLIFDGIQSSLSSTIRGCGLQKIGALVSICAFFVAGVPSALYLAFTRNMAAKGLYIGIVIALFFQSVGLFVVTLRIDWQNEAKRAQERAQVDVQRNN